MCKNMAMIFNSNIKITIMAEIIIVGLLNFHFYTTPLPYQSAGYAVHHDPFWQVHGVGNGQDNQSGSLVSRPIKEIVHDILFLSPKKVELPKNIYNVGETGRAPK